jgi:uncharacterized membrane protein
MAGSLARWSSHQTESVIGTLLRVGVLIAATVVACGGIVFMVHHGTSNPEYGVFQGEPAELRSVAGIIRAAVSFQALGVIQLGLLILIATPVARVAFSVVAFALERDALYVVVTLIVLGVLIFSLTGGHL